MTQKFTVKLSLTLRGLWDRLGAGFYSKDEIEAIKKEHESFLATRNPGEYIPMCVVVGQK